MSTLNVHHNEETGKVIGIERADGSMGWGSTGGCKFGVPENETTRPYLQLTKDVGQLYVLDKVLTDNGSTIFAQVDDPPAN